MSDARVSVLEVEPGLSFVHRQIIPIYDADGELLCPRCGKKVVSRSDDGKAARYDWWDCECGATGAYMHSQLPGITQNGIPLMGFSRLVDTIT